MQYKNLYIDYGDDDSDGFNDDVGEDDTNHYDNVSIYNHDSDDEHDK